MGTDRDNRAAGASGRGDSEKGCRGVYGVAVTGALIKIAVRLSDIVRRTCAQPSLVVESGRQSVIHPALRDIVAESPRKLDGYAVILLRHI